jgi:hypothetical protein
VVVNTYERAGEPGHGLMEADRWRETLGSRLTPV